MGWTAPQKRTPWTRIGTAKIIRQQSADRPRDWRDLAPPALQGLTNEQFAARSDWLSAVVNQVPQEQRIYWYGGMRRSWPGGDGGAGAWMTESIAADWPDRTDMGDIKHGPG